MDFEMEGGSSNQSRPTVCTEGWFLLPSAERGRGSGACPALLHTLGAAQPTPK